MNYDASTLLAKIHPRLAPVFEPSANIGVKSVWPLLRHWRRVFLQSTLYRPGEVESVRFHSPLSWTSAVPIAMDFALFAGVQSLGNEQSTFGRVTLGCSSSSPSFY